MNGDFKLEKLGFKSRHKAHSSPTQPPIQSVPESFSWGYTDHGVNSTTHLHLARSLGMNGATPPLPLYAIMAWIGEKTLFFNTSVRTQKKNDAFSYLIGFDQASWSPVPKRDCGWQHCIQCQHYALLSIFVLLSPPPVPGTSQNVLLYYRLIHYGQTKFHTHRK
jgi:hypothetical protein